MLRVLKQRIFQRDRRNLIGSRNGCILSQFENCRAIGNGLAVRKEPSPSYGSGCSRAIVGQWALVVTRNTIVRTETRRRRSQRGNGNRESGIRFGVRLYNRNVCGSYTSAG
jgi:hypothetical protein